MRPCRMTLYDASALSDARFQKERRTSTELCAFDKSLAWLRHNHCSDASVRRWLAADQRLSFTHSV